VTGTAAERRWLAWAFVYGTLVSLVVGYFLLRVPIQVTDSFTTLLALERPFFHIVGEQFGQAGYLRPAMWAELKLVHDLSGGDYTRWFRLTQALQVLALVWLYIRLVQPRSAAAMAVLPLGLAVLLGSHTFAWTVREAYPINTFLTMLLCCAAAANLSFARPRWWIDGLAAALFVVAALTVETGLLVWVIFVAGALVGLRGVSPRGLALVSAALAGYFVLRFALLDIGVPGLLERDSGFGFSRYTPGELAARFGASPWEFYAYNVVSGIATVLLSEPRDGVWRLTRSLAAGAPEWPLVVGFVSSSLATALIARFAWVRRERWRRWAFDRDDQLVLMFAAVLAANVVIGYAYAKDQILSPAGFFFAVAAFVGTLDLIAQLPARRLARTGALAVCVVLSVSWSLRAIGLHAGLSWTAIKVREQWAYVDDWLARVGSLDLSPRTRALRDQLQHDAVRRYPAPPPLREQWTQLFEVE
jgi:hypothetical protein